VPDHTRLTLDMTAIRDLTDEQRKGHCDGLKLLERADAGRIEIAIPPQGTLADLHGEFDGELARQVEQLRSRKGVVELPQLAYASDVTFPANNLLPGYGVDRLHQAWREVVGSWKTHEGRCPGDVDRWYVESHIAAKRDVLITDDGPLRALCRRLREEHGFAIEAESLAEYVARYADSTD
jgi:hypothetical protein